MTVIKINTFEHLANGTVLTAPNSGGTGSDAFNSVNITGTPTCRASTVHAAHGTVALEIVAATTQVVDLRYSGIADHVSGPLRQWFYLTGPPDATIDVGVARDSSGVVIAKQQIGVSSGQPQMRWQSGPTSTLLNSLNSLPLNSWFRSELLCDVNTGTPGSGRVRGGVWLADNTTPVSGSSFDNSAVNLGSNGISQYRYGKLTAAGNFPQFWMDDPSCNPGSSAFLGAGGTLPSPPTQSFDTYTETVIDCTATSGSGTWSLTQTSGDTAVSITQAVPGTIRVRHPASQAANMVFDLTLTDAYGQTDVDVVTIAPGGSAVTTIARDFMTYDAASESYLVL